MVSLKPLPKATVHSFSLFRHLRDRFRCYLSLVLPNSRNKQKALSVREETTRCSQHSTKSIIRLQMCSVSPFFVLSRNPNNNKGLITRINQQCGVGVGGDSCRLEFYTWNHLGCSFRWQTHVESVPVRLRHLLEQTAARWCPTVRLFSPQAHDCCPAVSQLDASSGHFGAPRKHMIQVFKMLAFWGFKSEVDFCSVVELERLVDESINQNDERIIV